MDGTTHDNLSLQTPTPTTFRAASTDGTFSYRNIATEAAPDPDMTSGYDRAREFLDPVLCELFRLEQNGIRLLALGTARSSPKVLQRQRWNEIRSPNLRSRWRATVLSARLRAVKSKGSTSGRKLTCANSQSRACLGDTPMFVQW